MPPDRNLLDRQIVSLALPALSALARDPLVRVIQFGRDVCEARLPRCWECPLEDRCPYPDKTPPPTQTEAGPAPRRGA